jgi:hypothetical protein
VLQSENLEAEGLDSHVENTKEIIDDETDLEEVAEVVAGESDEV